MFAIGTCQCHLRQAPFSSFRSDAIVNVPAPFHPRFTNVISFPSNRLLWMAWAIWSGLVQQTVRKRTKESSKMTRLRSASTTALKTASCGARLRSVQNHHRQIEVKINFLFTMEYNFELTIIWHEWCCVACVASSAVGSFCMWIKREP